MALWKKICAIAGTVLAIIVAAFIGGRLSNRRRVSGTSDDIQPIRDSLDRTGSEVDTARNAVRDSRDIVDDLHDGNRETSHIVERARQILADADARSKGKRGQNGGDSGTP